MRVLEFQCATKDVVYKNGGAIFLVRPLRFNNRIEGFMQGSILFFVDPHKKRRPWPPFYCRHYGLVVVRADGATVQSLPRRAFSVNIPRNCAICAAETSIGYSIADHFTPSLHGGVVNEPAYR